MNILIVYDSRFGYTEKVAEAIKKSLLQMNRVEMRRVEEAADVSGYDGIILGSPTHGGQATPAMQAFIKKLPYLNKINVAVFDTRIKADKVSKALQLLMKVIGYAAPKMAKSLAQKGATVVGEEGFLVKDKEGPLIQGELLRAGEWLDENALFKMRVSRGVM
jgi:menaquinone-dependent protoporphyrinogen IX oxidase